MFTVVCDADAVVAWRKFSCEPCGRVINGATEWEKHVKSRKHWKAVRAHGFLMAAGGDAERAKQLRREHHPAFKRVKVDDASVGEAAVMVVTAEGASSGGVGGTWCE